MSLDKPSPESIAESQRSTDQSPPKDNRQKEGWLEKTSTAKVGIDNEDAQYRLIESNRKVAKTIVKIDDVEVLFPFQDPYQCQVNMMEAVVQCIKEKKHGLIESPTGTGKTLSILCAAIAAVQQQRRQAYNSILQRQLASKKLENDGKCQFLHLINYSKVIDEKSEQIEPPTKIIFCTRTHSQIEQIFTELRSKLPYFLRVSPFASRKQSCIFEDLPERFPGNALNLSCKLLRRLNTIQRKLDPNAVLKLKQGAKDIEDTSLTVVSTGCPFFYGFQNCNEEVYKGRADSTLKQQEDMSNFVANRIPWDQPLSVSDFTKVGKINNFCPYYLMRSRVKQCDLAILPYNYILDSDLRDQVGISLENAILIFDEGHNIEQQCEELFAFDLSINDLFCSYQVLNQIWLDLQAEEQFLTDYSRHQVRGQRVDTKACCVFVLKMIDVLESYNLHRPDNQIFNKGFPPNIHVYKLPELFSIFAMVFGKIKDEKDFVMDKMRKSNFHYSDGQYLKMNQDSGVIDAEHSELSFLDKITLFVNILEKCITESGDKAKALNKLHDMLSKTRIAYQHYLSRLGEQEDDSKSFYDFYVCILDEQFGDQPQQNANKRRLGMWCFNPSFSFKQLLQKQPRCVIFASGTLAPLNSYASEMETEFPIQIENDHVVDKSLQVLVGVLPNDHNGRPINFSYKSREDIQFFVSFAHTLIKIFAQVQGGVLIFVPSYTVLTKIKKVWRANKLFKEIQKERDVFIEDHNQTKNKGMLEDYLSTVAQKGKAAFFAVCRGKLAEGIDFTDDAARCVIIAGIPFPQVFDPKVLIKKDYLDKKFASKQSQINGNQWYKLQAFRAVNQAIGRVIRHIKDYGAILLLDERFSKTNDIQISKWLHDCKKHYSKFDDLEADLQAFFKRNRQEFSNDKTSPESKISPYRLARKNVLSAKKNMLSGAKRQRGRLGCNKDTPEQVRIEYEFEATVSGAQRRTKNAELDAIMQKEDTRQLAVLDQGEFDDQKEEKECSTKFQHKPGYNVITNNGAFKRNYRQDFDEGEFFAESLEFEGEGQPTTVTPDKGVNKIDLRGANLGFSKDAKPLSYKRKPYKRH